MQDTQVENKNFLSKAFYYFDKLTSNHGKDALLVLTWIFIFELISSIIEYSYLDIAQKYIYHLPESFIKEMIIALLVVVFVWYCVYSIIFMKRNVFFFLAFYFSLGAYLIITHDVTLNLLAHNLVNPFEFEFNGFGFYMFIQIFIKILITYLIYKFIVSLKNKKS